LTQHTREDPENFYRKLPRERAVFVEYHYWKTHMKVVAESHRISLGRAYEILYRAEKKIASSRTQEEEKDA
jgi:hypothetical protein